MTSALATAYRSGAQQTRVVTEFWGEHNLYCPNCVSPKLDRLRNNTKASDYSCPSCGSRYQLKGQKTRFGKSISDGAYAAMMDAIRKDETPNFYFLHYDLATWGIRNLLLIPSFAFPTSAIIKRKPLSATARRAGWIGCNIALHRIPSDARIPVVTETVVLPANEVRARFKRVKPLSEIKAKERGWTLDVLNAVRRLAAKPANLLDCGGKRSATPFLSSAAKRFQSGVTVAALQNEFTTAEVYAFERELAQLHPGNRHVRDKIRQQLQVLRDAGLLIHVERGRWRLL